MRGFDYKVSKFVFMSIDSILFEPFVSGKVPSVWGDWLFPNVKHDIANKEPEEGSYGHFPS